MRAFFPSLVVAVGLSACAPMAQPQAQVQAEAQGDTAHVARQCFQPFRIRNFRVDRQTIYLRVDSDAVYPVDAGACRDLGLALGIGVTPLAGASSLCTGDLVAIVSPADRASAEVCRARLGTRLTDEQVAALPSRARP